MKLNSSIKKYKVFKEMKLIRNEEKRKVNSPGAVVQNTAVEDTIPPMEDTEVNQDSPDFEWSDSEVPAVQESQEFLQAIFAGIKTRVFGIVGKLQKSVNVLTEEVKQLRAERDRLKEEAANAAIAKVDVVLINVEKKRAELELTSDSVNKKVENKLAEVTTAIEGVNKKVENKLTEFTNSVDGKRAEIEKNRTTFMNTITGRVDGFEKLVNDKDATNENRYQMCLSAIAQNEAKIHGLKVKAKPVVVELEVEVPMITKDGQVTQAKKA